MEDRSPTGHRERLLEAAIVCLHEKGYARTTARDLVAASETNLASIGYHYGSKEHLLNVAVVDAFKRWLKPLVALAAEADESTTPLERLQRSLVAVHDSIEENSALVTACLEAWAQLGHSDDLRAEMAAAHAEFHEAIADTTREAFADIGVTEGIDADAVASLIMALFDGLLVRWQLDPERMPSATRLIEAALGAFMALSGVTRPLAEPGPSPAEPTLDHVSGG